MTIALDLQYYDSDIGEQIYRIMPSGRGLCNDIYISVRGAHSGLIAHHISRVCNTPILFRANRAPWKGRKYYLLCSSNQEINPELWNKAKHRCDMQVRTTKYKRRTANPVISYGSVDINVGLLNYKSKIFNKEFSTYSFRNGDRVSSSFTTPELITRIIDGRHDELSVNIVSDNAAKLAYNICSGHTTKRKEWITETGLMLAEKFAREKNIIGY